MRDHDWAATPLGPIDNWPNSLRIAAQMVSASAFPCCLTWGSQLITIYNEAFRPILGQKPEAMGRPFSEVWQEAWHIIGPIADRALAGEPTFIEDFPLRIERNGMEEDAAFTFCYSPVRDEHGRVVGMLDTVIETTKRVAAEREQARSLREAEDILLQSQKMDAVGQLAGGLAHDFNNLLSSVAGSLDLIGMRLARDNTANVERYIEIAQSGIKRASTLTHRLLAFSRPQTLAPRPTDPNHLIAGMAELITRSIGPSIALQLQLAPAPWTTLVDPHQLENALLNLCLNSRDAMPDGGDLRVRTRNVHLDGTPAAVIGALPGDYLEFGVTDSGCGMAPETVARIFEPFFTTKAPGRGTGLGMSILHRFMRESLGYIRVHSQPGAGTEVVLYLPRFVLPDEIASPAPVEARLGPVAGHGETILLVDGEAAVRSLVAEVLRDLGLRVIEAVDGPDALVQLSSTTPIELLVTDLGLPGRMSGRDVAAAASRLRPGLPVLYISGYGEEALSDIEREQGVELVSKPFDFDDLVARICRLACGLPG
ncbi:ATP-binding protein [Bordetella genomosp. 5]|uniref:histidine kinase n=1 Tax=Bordetella genomosp. 5 TaxID=1395608 RepID=A0A261T8A2_9BORD|nr:ATP-binding protein [Bordetella genomosp. 5]OZI45844.1 hybrid sensor histidine kinase/response regulator [Bordetella genomosp. 5]